MRAVRHVGIVVRQIEKSLAFYRDLLGLRVERVMTESGEFVETLMAMEDVVVTTVKLGAHEGPTLLELLEFQSPRSEPIHPLAVYCIGHTHVAFTVDDLDTLYQTLCEAGVRFDCSPKLSPEGLARVAFCRDPDGTRIELVEVQKRRD